MAKRQVFYSFHFKNDVFRVQQVRNMGVIEGNQPVSPNTWEEVKRQGEASIKKWIDENMKGRSCVVVLVGTETASRPWVQYEIKKAWNDGKGLVGIHIHNLKCPHNGRSSVGRNPFELFDVGETNMARIVKCYNPSSYDTYNDIAKNFDKWIEEAIQIRQRF